MKQGMFYLLALLFTPLVIAAGSPAGEWTINDEQTGKKRVILQLDVSGDSLTGTIVKVFPQPGDSGFCKKCPGKFKDKSVQNLQIIWGLKDKGNGLWEGGKILDPQTGNIYKAKMSLDGDKLHVRGYLGISAIGRTQTWVKNKHS
ncbi:MAG: DUF2147 domain-containing protein [Tatlockia sp.]|nr:DUF2147 domain-containing protein [Tatlockia sp.]